MFNATAAFVNLNQIFDAFYSSVVLLDSQRRIVCCNETFARLVGAARPQNLVAKDFYVTLNKPRFTDGDFCPLHFVATRGVQTRTFFVVPGPDGDENASRFYEMIASPFASPDGEPQFLVSIQDVTETARDDRRLQRLSKTRAELYLLLDQAARQGLSPQKRMEKLKALVQKHMRATLRYDVYEMRRLEADKKLTPFLSLGMGPDAQIRPLYASPSKNGISGYVASCGEPYICDDVKNDPYYIQGAIDAASSITLPILYLSDGDSGVKVLGVVNVESRSPNAFTRRDVRFLELYLSDLAQVLHRLDLLETETARVRAECAQKLCDDFFKASANVVGAAFERCAQKSPQSQAEELETFAHALGVREATQRLKHAVKRLTSQWRGRSIAPPDDAAQFEELQYRRVLLVDRDVRFLESCVDAFESYGLVVDVATNTDAALAMLRTVEYDLVVGEFYPDGEYFTSEEKDSAIGVNPFGCNLFDIHLPNYVEPVVDNPRDAEIRRRVASLIADGKRDAYFLYQAIQTATLAKKPKFLVSIDGSYDPTHILRDLNANFQYVPLNVHKSAKTEAQLKQLLKAVRQSDV